MTTTAPTVTEETSRDGIAACLRIASRAAGGVMVTDPKHEEIHATIDRLLTALERAER